MGNIKSNKINNSGNLSRRNFIKNAAGGTLLGTSLFSNTSKTSGSSIVTSPMSHGPASRYVPKIKAAFVRRKEEYGFNWPGAVYDGEQTFRNYCKQIERAGKEYGVNIDIRPEEIYSLEETERWVAEAKAEKVDGLFFVVHDRQKHSWPSAYKVLESNIPTVVFAPIGTAFTTNTTLADVMNKGLICSTNDFSQALYGIKMIKAGAKLRETKVAVLKGNERKKDKIKHFGTKLNYLPPQVFIDEFNNLQTTGEIRRIAEELISNATHIAQGPTKQDILNGIKSYVAAKNIIEREGADAITMDCLGPLRKLKVSLPCTAWSMLNDEGIPAACEADLTAVVTHCLIQYLFDRPGFQQDPFPDTAKCSLGGSHCTCATRLNGFSEPQEPYYIYHHHAMRDATPRTMWKVGQRVTVFDIVFNQTDSGRTRFAHRFPIDKDDKRPEMIISSGEVIENISVPPSGGCVISVNIKLDGVDNPLDLLAYPGFHQIFCYGDFKKELREYCSLYNIKPLVI